MEVRSEEYRLLRNSVRSAVLFLAAVCLLFLPSFAYADTEAAVCARFENGEALYYSTLHEAFTAAGGTSLDKPDEIILLADVVLDEPIIIESGKHVRLVAGGGERTITRGDNIDYPLFWFRGDDASFILGKPPADGDTPDAALIIDGGYLNEPSIMARSPLVAVNGCRSRLVMYDGVTLRNNYNRGDTDGTDIYGFGSGVFLSDYHGGIENRSEFIMKGGQILGNINNTQNPYPSGGGVLILSYGLFTMEGGEILGNTACRAGGGFYAEGRGSFKKTGGVIYGEDAEAGLRNTVIDGTGVPVIYGHTLCVAITENHTYQFRDDTVGEDDFLSYSGAINGQGIFGSGEKWEHPGDDRRRLLAIVLTALFLACGTAVFLIVKTRRKKQAAMSARSSPSPALLEIIQNLTPGEKGVFDLLLTDCSLKEIASNLDIGYSGAHFHTQNIYKKLGVKNRTEFIIKFK